MGDHVKAGTEKFSITGIDRNGQVIIPGFDDNIALFTG